jgi:deoxycytidine triphosphate deaminase
MSHLSNRDIIRELGRGIFFHPLKPGIDSHQLGSIRACDLCLTASEYAYAIGKKERLIIQTEPKQDKPSEEQKFFYIPPKDTALVWTDESVYLSAYFRGSLYSVVGLVSKGVGHIGTRVNPCWSGVLCIALHNTSDEQIKINVRDVNQPIAYLAIEKLSSKSSTNSNSDSPARLDVLRELPNRHEIDDFFNQKEHNWMKGDKDTLKKLMLDSNEYKKNKRGISDLFLLRLGSDEMSRWTAVAAIAALLTALCTAIQVFQPYRQHTTKSTSESELNRKVNSILPN